MVVILGHKTSANSEVQRSSALAIQEGSGSPRRIPPRIGRARKARRDSTHSFATPPFVSFYGYVTSSTRVVRLRGSRQTARAPPRAGREVTSDLGSAESKLKAIFRGACQQHKKNHADPGWITKSAAHRPGRASLPPNVDEVGHLR